MNLSLEQFEVNVLRCVSFFGLDFSFSNLTLYLVLAIIVILTLSYLITKGLSLIPNYWQSVIEIFYSFIFSMLVDQAGKKAKVFFPAIFSLFFFILFEDYDLSQTMMLGFFKPKKSATFNISSIKNNFIINFLTFRRQYTSQAIMDNLVSKKKVSTIDVMSADALCSRLVDPTSNINITPHQLDLFLQKSFKKYSLTLSDLLKNFNLSFFFNNRPNLRLIHQELQKSNSHHYLYQRTNTLGELTCIEACRRNFNFLKKIEMTWGKNIDPYSAALTGNVKPDYACCIVLGNNVTHYYHADLKNTTILSFEKMVLRLHPHQIINTNIYWIRDKNVNDSYIFSGVSKLRLESTYIGVIQFYKRLDPNLARQMHLNSSIAFKKFQQTGSACDYNEIPISTPKFIFSSWISQIL